MFKKFINLFKGVSGAKVYRDPLENYKEPKSFRKGTEGSPQQRIPEKMVFKRAEILCKGCGDPMFVSVGQACETHRACRKNYRRHLRSA